MKPETISEELLFTTVLIISIFPLEPTTGTGFLYQFDDDTGSKLFLVTNKHIIFDHSRGGMATGIQIKFIKADAEGNAKLGETATLNVENFAQNNWHGHPNPEVDLAIIPLGGWVNQMHSGGQIPFYRTISPNILFESGVNPELDALEEVTFVGYPNGLFDSENHLPLFRRGITASSVNIDFNGKPNFIIDAGVYPGSSGSPVFILDQGWIRDRKGNVSTGSRIILLGVISNAYLRTSKAQVVESAVALSATVQEIIGLGTVIKARCINETVQSYLSSLGLSKV